MIVREARPDELIAVGELTAAAYLADGFVPPYAAYLDELRDAATRSTEAELGWSPNGEITLLTYALDL